MMVCVTPPNPIQSNPIQYKLSTLSNHPPPPAISYASMTTIPFTPTSIFSFSDRLHALQSLLSLSRFNISNSFSAKRTDAIGLSRSLRFRVYCESKAQELQVRRCSPYLENKLPSSNGAVEPDDWIAVPDIWRYSSEKYGDRVALVDPYHDPPTNMTYKQLHQEILDFSEGLRVIGIQPDEKVSLFADNSCRWLVTDQGIMATGAINVVRGSRSSVEELLQIYNHSNSVALAVDGPELFSRISDTFYSKAAIRYIILLWGDKSCLGTDGGEGLTMYNYQEIINLGRESHQTLGRDYRNESINIDDIATLIYTSGTTGNPKGVMLSHKNLLHQIKNLWDIVPAEAGDRFLSMLPPWHAYERACEYFTFSYGIEQVYTTVRNLKEDLRLYQPNYVVSVPLVYETLYSGIQKQISSSSTLRKFVALMLIKVSLSYMEAKRIYEGMYLTNQKQSSYLVSVLDCFWARFVAAILWPLHVLAKRLIYRKILSAIGMTKGAISGGGSLPSHVEKFFEAIGVKVLNGYGLTESSPVISCRYPTFNVLGSVGHPLPHTEIKVVDANTGEVLPAGSKGIIKARGPQVMKGYYKNPEATNQVLDKDGWLDTGDLGWIAPPHSIGRSRCSGGVIVLEGRAKDTIVLSTGENVEPAQLEEAAIVSSLIQQIVVIGQDQRRLGAIIVPNKEEILMLAKTLSNADANAAEISKDNMTGILYEEVKKRTSGCSFQIGPILVVDEPFTIDSGLMTPTMKIRRDKVVAKYKDQIADMYK